MSTHSNSPSNNTSATDTHDDPVADWLATPGHHRLTVDGDDYPPLLAGIAGPPAALFVAGDVDALHLPAIAIVGSRNPSRSGYENALGFSRSLVEAGFCIVSGLAQGIDTAAHRGALQAGGRTVAVLGHGLDQVYPRSNRTLAADIAAGGGALVSEFELGEPARREHFPQRNRLISGLSLGTLVVEAARRSGSLITARCAGDQGREVFAIPGSIHNPMSRGCHRLIRQGAHLVETVDDILEPLAPLISHVMQNPSVAAGSATPRRHDEDYLKLLEVLAFDPQSPEQLARNSGLTIAEVSSMLLILELDGEVEALPGGQFSRLSR